MQYLKHIHNLCACIWGHEMKKRWQRQPQQSLPVEDRFVIITLLVVDIKRLLLNIFLYTTKCIHSMAGLHVSNMQK